MEGAVAGERRKAELFRAPDVVADIDRSSKSLGIGAATATFPLVLTLLGLRARTPEGTVALSSVTQSVGYLIAAVGPFTIGALHDVTGGWTWPLAVLLATVLPLFVVAAYVARPAVVEDQLRRPAAHVRP